MLNNFVFIIIFISINVSNAFLDLSVFTNFLSKYVGDSGKEECGPNGPDTRKEICDENKLMLHLAKLYVISPERVILLATADSLNDVCRDVQRTISKADKDFQHCTKLGTENLYMKLLESLKAFSTDVCQSDSRSKKLCKYSECLKELHEEYLDCEGPADWFEKSNKTIVCQIFTDILDCNYIKTGELCGMDPAYTMRAISLDIFKPILPSTCSTRRQLPKIKEPMPPMPQQGYRCSRNTLLIFSSVLMLVIYQIFIL